MNKELTPEELRIASKIAKRFSYQWRTIDPQDLNSELILWMLEHYETVNKWRFAIGGQGKLVVSLKRLAARYCANETAANIHKPLDTNFHYTIEQIAVSYTHLTLPTNREV